MTGMAVDDTPVAGWIFVQNLRPFLERVSQLLGGSFDDEAWLGLVSQLLTAEASVGEQAVVYELAGDRTAEVTMSRDRQGDGVTVIVECGTDPAFRRRVEMLLSVFAGYRFTSI